MVEKFKRARIRCPIVVYEDKNVVFWQEKDPKMTIIQKFPDF